MTGVWVATQAHRGHIAAHECKTERSAHKLANTLPGKVEVTYQYQIGEAMSDKPIDDIAEQNRAKLIADAVQAHEDYLEYVKGAEKLKARRRAAFKRAVYNQVHRQELADAIGLAVRTISHITNGK